MGIVFGQLFPFHPCFCFFNQGIVLEGCTGSIVDVGAPSPDPSACRNELTLKRYEVGPSPLI